MKRINKALRILVTATTAVTLLIAVPGGIANVGIPAAHAETATTKLNADTLLKNTRRALGAILVGYKRSPEGKTKASGLVIKAAASAGTEIGKLEKALKSKKSKDISRSTQAVSVAIGKLQSTYKLARVQDRIVTEGMLSASSNWAAYVARYGLAKAEKRKTKPSAKQVKGLKNSVSAMDKRLRGLSAKAANDARLARDLAGLVALLAAIRAEEIAEANYQDMLFRMSVLNGWYLGYAGFAEYYYSDYYYYFRDGYRDFSSYDAYWTGYYDGYYASWPDDYYDREFDYPDLVGLYVDDSVYEETNIYVDNSVNIFNTEVAAAAAAYDEFEAVPEDLPQAEAAAVVESVADEADFYAGDAQPDADELSKIEAEEAAIDDATFSTELAAESDALIEDGTAVEEDPVAEEEAAVEEQPFPDDAAIDEEPATGDEADTADTAAGEVFAEEPTEEQTDGQMVAEEPAYEEPAYEEPAYEEPAYEEPAYEEPAYEAPAYEEPAYEEPAYEEPAYEEPAYEEPAYEEPAYEEPAPQEGCTEEFPCE